MAHSHSGCQSPRDYFTEQLLTILVCAGLAFVAVQLYRYDMLRHILAPQFHLPVLIAGIAVFALVLLRAAAVWREAGELVPASDDPTCAVNHVHTAACDHPLPGMPGAPNTDENLVDDHGHSHDMSWVFARMLVLVFPIALFAQGLPNSGLSAKGQLDMAGADVALDAETLKEMAKSATVEESRTEADGSIVRVLKTATGLRLREVTRPGGEPTLFVVPGDGSEMRFNTLTEAAFDPSKRAAYTNQTAIMEGRFKRLSEKEFTLFRMKMTCCGPDAVPLKVRIIAPYSVDFKDFTWVRVKGVVQFVQVPGEDRYVPVIRLGDVTADDIKAIPNDQIKNEYEF